MISVVAQIPNVLTLSRIAAAPILILLLRDENFELALILFVLAGLTDGLDGWIAKRFNCASQLGARLDPLADKIIIISAYFMLVLGGMLPFWLVTLVIFRDAVIVGGYLVLTTLDGDIPMQPTKSSKTNTVLQITLVIAVLFEKHILAGNSPHKRISDLRCCFVNDRQWCAICIRLGNSTKWQTTFMKLSKPASIQATLPVGRTDYATFENYHSRRRSPDGFVTKTIS